MKLHTITIGSTYEGTVKIIKKINVGPVIILMVTDGTKIVDAVVKHTEFDAGDVVSIRGFVGDRNGSLRIEVQSIQKSTVPFDTVIADQAKVAEKAFSIRSERFEKLKPYFYDIAFKIRKAVLSGQPILIRHHNDTDGISAGLALEESCKMLMESVGIDANKSLYRAVCKAPFYETPDMLKDLSLSKRLQGFGQLKPLIIVTDNGSTPEDVNAMKSMHALGHDIIVIDHHNPVVLENKKTAVCPYLIAHMNPYIEGLDGKTCCGMLNYELGRLIFDGFDSVIFAAISGISDRCDIQETEDYIAKTGIDREHLKNIGTVIDYVSYNLRFDTASDVYYEVLNNKKFVDTLLQEVKTGMETQ
ncbi:MAG: DHH family phosphoesterase, partial [Candidatus Woesearchaeota archaeon]